MRRNYIDAVLINDTIEALLPCAICWCYLVAQSSAVGRNVPLQMIVERGVPEISCKWSR